jgi:hypothetical protein
LLIADVPSFAAFIGLLMSRAELERKSDDTGGQY